MGVPRRITVAAALITALLPGACSRRPPPGVLPAAARPVVARLATLGGSVECRRAGTLTWISAHAGMELFHRDALKTNRGGSARVTFRTGNWLDVDEDSLVVVEAPAAVPAVAGGGASSGGASSGGASSGGASSGAAPTASAPLRSPEVALVEKGTVRGVSSPGAPPVKLVTADGQTAYISAEGNEAVPFRARVGASGKLEVAVLKGSARVRSGTESVVVKPQQVVEITRDNRLTAVAPLPQFPELSSPAVDAKFHAGARVPLKWQAVGGVGLYRVQVAETVSFESRLVEETVTVPELSLTQPRPGKTYVWRVCSVDAAGREGEYGFARRFHVLSATPAPRAELVTPPDNAGVQYVGAPQPITFAWRSEGASFELVVARQPDLRRPVWRKRTKESRYAINALGAGTYYWGVNVIDADGKKRAIVDKARRLVIAVRLPPGLKVPQTIDWK